MTLILTQFFPFESKFKEVSKLRYEIANFRIVECIIVCINFNSKTWVLFETLKKKEDDGEETLRLNDTFSIYECGNYIEASFNFKNPLSVVETFFVCYEVVESSCIIIFGYIAPIKLGI